MTPDDDKPFPEHLRMPPIPVLETERLILRPPCERDVPAIQRRFAQWEVVRYLTSDVPWPYPDDGAAVHFKRMSADIAGGQKSHWAITLRGGDDELIGLITLWADDGVSCDQRGFWLDPEFWGRGLMTEAANQVTDYALLELGWPQLWLNNAEVNPASHRVRRSRAPSLSTARRRNTSTATGFASPGGCRARPGWRDADASERWGGAAGEESKFLTRDAYFFGCS
jgi:RimJ/RimL family protein N-acetyltransferase